MHAYILFVCVVLFNRLFKKISFVILFSYQWTMSRCCCSVESLNMSYGGSIIEYGFHNTNERGLCVRREL